MATIRITYRTFKLSHFRHSFPQPLVLLVCFVFFCLSWRIRLIRSFRRFGSGSVPGFIFAPLCSVPPCLCVRILVRANFGCGCAALGQVIHAT